MANISFTAETHNFPTGISPFQGATTGVGGRIRDTQAIGLGGLFVAGTAGYCVGPLKSSRYDRISPIDMLLRASDGASDYGNKIGEPIIQGFCRANRLPNEAEWVKPIMFSGGIGHVYEQHLHKLKPEVGWNIVRVGGPTYRLGIGGGAASSVSQTNQSINRLLSAVQRGDAQTENRMDAWLRACISRLDHNPILSVHDQGAGGMANVTKEILEGVGGVVDLRRVTLGDRTLSNAEIWVSESQEQITTLIRPSDIPIVREIAYRERVHLDVVGEVTDTGRIMVSGTACEAVVDLPLRGINPPVKVFDFSADDYDKHVECLASYLLLTERNLISTLSSVDVGSKRFLTNKVDRSVGGLIAQQQCVGPFQTPLSNVAVIANSLVDPNDFTGAATAIGERMMSVGKHWIQFSIFEMLTNLMWAPITCMSDIKCSGNWMWPAKTAVEKKRMFVSFSLVSRFNVFLKGIMQLDK
jgi:phosphoribosylformylglycinamidine synthase